MRINLLLLLAIAVGACADEQPVGSSERGARLFETQRCSECHSVNGRGGNAAPDLGRRIGREHTPALVAASLWNHAPVMWGQMQRQSIAVPALGYSDAADLFAFFYSARFFDLPGDAGRGKQAFARHRCSGCHSVGEVNDTSSAPAVSTWRSVGSPVALTEAMWNHAVGMKSEFERRGFKWPELTSQEFTDIVVYLSNLPSIRRTESKLDLVPSQDGKAVFESKRCAECHTGALTLQPRLQGRTLHDIAAAMWNHAPKMAGTADTFNPGEMNAVLNYLWADQFFKTAGDSRRGSAIFREKSCAQCHTKGPAPQLTGRFDAIRMVSALWTHGPSMFEQIEKQGLRWPRFGGHDMGDLIAFLNQGK